MCRNTLPTQSSETVERHSYLWDSVYLHSQTLGHFKGPVFPFLIRRNSSLSLMVSWSGDWQFEPFQEAQSEVAPRHWHGHRNRWDYSFPMVWPPFPGPLWGTCVSASGIWVRWSAIFIQIIARKTSIHLETKRASSWFIWKKNGDFIDNTFCYLLCSVLHFKLLASQCGSYSYAVIMQHDDTSCLWYRWVLPN